MITFIYGIILLHLHIQSFTHTILTLNISLDSLGEQAWLGGQPVGGGGGGGGLGILNYTGNEMTRNYTVFMGVEKAST